MSEPSAHLILCPFCLVGRTKPGVVEIDEAGVVEDSFPRLGVDPQVEAAATSVSHVPLIFLL